MRDRPSAKRGRYPTTLRRQPRVEELIARVRHGPRSPGPSLSQLVAEIGDIWEQHRNRAIDALFAHYQVSKTAPDAWRSLALLLARDHVPALRLTDRPAPGRPRNPRKQLAVKRSRGRPRDPRRERNLLVLRMVALDIMRKQKLQGRGAQRRAARILVEQWARQRGGATSRAKWVVPMLEKLLSEGKRRFPGTDPNQLFQENTAILCGRISGL